jgi:glycosidase
MTAPFWVKDSIFYQIFPDRFANGDPTNDPPNVQKWGSTPTIGGFQGGDLQGIIRHFDYLLDLGITALYLNPIFTATSNHRYNTSDFYQIDPKLGTLADFHSLIETAHRHEVRVVLDGVFNHVGRGFFAFVDVLENGDQSPYKDWFHISGFPLDAYSTGELKNYLAWWNIKSLPKLNTSNKQVRKYIFDVARHWIDQGIDGWRLDVPNEIDDDGFWEEFQHVVKTANRDAYLLGEIWDINPRWIDGKHFDGLMNYPVRDALITLLQERENASQFKTRMDRLFKSYSAETMSAMYVPLDSHDTVRFKTVVDGDVEKLKLAFLFQMAFPGAPAIYYGDEIGLEGGKDPDSRRAFPWKESSWDTELRTWVKTLVTLRKRNDVLRRGDFHSMLAEDDQLIFSRNLGAERVLVVLNTCSHARQIQVSCASLGWDEGHEVINLINNERYVLRNGQITLKLDPWSGGWIGRLN